jgi:peptidylamidoglycolate lyase
MNSRLHARGVAFRGGVAGAVLVGALVTIAIQNHVGAAAGGYRLVEAWPQTPPSLTMGFVSWMAVDSRGAMYVFRRCPLKCSDGTHPAGNDPLADIFEFDAAGRYVQQWQPKSGGNAKEAHGLQIDRHGNFWTTDVQLQVVKKYAADGTLLMTLGKNGVAGDGPDTFDKPTNVLVAADDSVFVTDGYGNQRVVKFSPKGAFVKAWGKKGTAPGEFRIPHAVAQDRSGRIIVADRCGLGETRCTDGRIQIFDTDGKYLAQWSASNGTLAPQAVFVDSADRLYIDDTQNSKVWILDAKSLKTLETVEGASGHGMTVSTSGDDIYITGGTAGVRRYSRSAGIVR